MPSFFSYYPKLQDQVRGSAIAILENANKTKLLGNEAVSQWYSGAGKAFIPWVKNEYRTHKGDVMHSLEPFWDDLLRIIGNPWFEKVFLQKAAQVGYTEAIIALSTYCVSELRISVGLGFEQQGKMQEMVGERIQPALSYIPKVIEQRKNHTRKDIDSKSSITIAGALLWFFYAGTKKAGGYTQAPSTLRSKPANMIIADEWGLYPPSILDVAISRMNASELPTKLVRAGSTPGELEGVVDREIRLSHYLFEWTITCRSCKTTQQLNPYSNFLKSKVTEDGDTYLDSLGYPLDWFHKNPKDKIGSAYIGCSCCGRELSRGILNKGHFSCTNTGIKLKDLIDITVKEQKPIKDTIALIIPRLASRLFEPTERIRRLVKTRNPIDELQQGLGVAASVGRGKISVKALTACVNTIKPDGNHDFVVAGVDVGRSCFYVTIFRWWWGDSNDKDDKYRHSFKELIFSGKVMGDESILDELRDQYNINYFGIDNEPEYNMVTKYALEHRPLGGGSADRLETLGQVFLFDQQQMRGQQFNRTIRKTFSAVKGRRAKKEGNDVVIYNIDRTYFLDQVRGRVYERMVKLPDKTVYDASDNENYLYHYTTSDRVDGAWIEPKGYPDHFFHSDGFAEAAVLVSLYEPGFGGVFF